MSVVSTGLLRDRQKTKGTFSSEPLLIDNSKIPYLYVTGATHSGSTLLAFLLNAHPEVVSISEIEPAAHVKLDTYRCSCGKLLHQCPFFVELERRINALGSSFSLMNWQTMFRLSQFPPINVFLARPLKFDLFERMRDYLAPLWPGYRRRIADISMRTVNLARSALSISHKRIFVDVQKDSIRIKFLSQIPQLDLRVIHLVKDVRGFVASRMKAKQTVAAAARFWRNQNMNSDRMRRYVSPDRWLRIPYEELCFDTQGTINRICDFAGIPRHTLPTDFYEAEHHIIGNEMRRKGAGSGLIRLDESWKERLRENDFKVIAPIAGRANRYFGYDWP